ncbi:MAG: bifunctional (p)ppGpp synthetase/guanosine-3',5'-bis(diphosphate) 3'-pyrophosphohydrolase [Bacteroidaceae bacterium]|nr:bifunctional (p)ppGpp synthetase/guanosine-3',5'-bis(diphosphate) 3'-pyrophosphohydrolase [Bacteroidaceae bacterium]
MNDFEKMVIEQRDELFACVAQRGFDADEIDRIHRSYYLAEEAHRPQRRKSGEPYILHPIAVAMIVANEIGLGANPICAALLHDVVEDTDHTIKEIRELFGDDVATIVDTVTKRKSEKYETSLQVDNYKQMLQSIHYDIRALLLKLADRLHNMRTLKSMLPHKQLKIASETDYFYAPLAHRLGLYQVKTELENLSFRYRQPHEYDEVKSYITNYVETHAEAAEAWMQPIRETLERRGIKAKVVCEPRSAYSIYAKMKEDRISLSEVEHIRIVHIVYDNWKEMGMSEKEMALFIYTLITSMYVEKPSSMNSYLDVSKDNNYRSLHCKLMGNEGRWMEVHIASTDMMRVSNRGCLVDRDEHGIERWIDNFKRVLRELADQGKSGRFMEDVRSTFYEDDIYVFTPKGKMVILPKGATAIDFAFEIHNKIGEQMKFAIINDKLCSAKTVLRKGDRVRIGTDDVPSIDKSWLNHVITYKARVGIRRHLNRHPVKVGENFVICPECKPISGDEVIGFKLSDGRIEVHQCHCPHAIEKAAQKGDSIEQKVDMREFEQMVYPIHFHVESVNKDQLLLAIVSLVSDTMKLSLGNLQSTIEDDIVSTDFEVYVHSHNEIKQLKDAISSLPHVYGMRTY